MSTSIRFLLFALAAVFLLGARVANRYASSSSPISPNAVNPVVGDASYVAHFGHQPTANTPDFERIQTHLAYAEQQLRQHTPTGLPLTQRQRRAHLLDLLHAYWQAGVFPSNEAPDGQRHPCFIDRVGRICAVGYLVEQTAGRAVAERINTRFQYSELLAMHEPVFSRWVGGSGLSLAECALIQPTYGPTYVPVASSNSIPTGYGTASAVLGGVNLSAIVFNSSEAGHQAGRWLPLLTMASGTTQLIMGATRFPEVPQPSFNGTTLTNESQKILSFANIGVGTATLLFGTWNLLHRPATTSQPPRTSWNVGPVPAGAGQRPDGMSLFVSRRL